MKSSISPLAKPATATVGTLLLLAFATPALAAGFKICDKASRAETLEVPTEELSVHVVDHGDAKAAVVEADANGKSTAAKTVKPAAGPSIAEAVKRKKAAAETSDERNTQPSGGGGESSPGITTRLPGVDEHDAVRFRSEMYRTDI